MTKASQVLRAAALNIQKRYEQGSGTPACCYAIDDVFIGRLCSHSAGYRADELFLSLFGYDDSGFSKGAFWFGHKFDKEETEHRIIALLLTADMAESVGE